MSNGLTTTEALEGEYIAAGEPDHNEKAEAYKKMRDAMEQQQHAFSAQAAQQNQEDALRRQAEGMRNVGMQGAGLGGLGNIGQSAAAALFGFR